MKKMYIINDGNMFYGTVDDFKDCFFDNANDETISDWCEEMGFTLEIKMEN